MAEDHFFVELAKLKTVEANVKKVDRLFHVDITITVHDEFNHAKIHLTSSNGSNLSQKNIEKAQTYLQAALEISENFTREKIYLSKHQNIMVLLERNNIERLCQVVLVDKNEYIIVQGGRGCVNMACEKIYSISDKRRLTSLTCDSDPLLLEDFQELDIGNIDENIDNSPLHSSHFKSEKYDKDEFSPKGLGYDGQGKYLEQLTDDNLETDCYVNPAFNLVGVGSHETEADRILSDPNNSPQIEKALKLGYSENHIVAVLKKLKVSATEVDSNTLLSELIKVSNLAPETCDDESSPHTLQRDDDDDDETEDSLLEDDADNLRHIVIDGSNVAMSHGNKDVFSCRGIQLAVDYFQKRGHKKITVFVPQWRKEFSRNNSQITDQDILKNLEKEKKLKFTPSRRISGRRVVCYDDRFILELAHSQNGIIVSNDNYRDLHNEKKEYKKVAEEQLLQYLFVDDKFMPPQDPLGRHGPTLDNFLRIRPIVSEPQQPCPYGKKCTYGNKCRFSHPERGNRPHRSVTEMLTEQSSQKLKDRAIKLEEKKKKDMSRRKQNLRRTQSMFPDENGSYESLNLHSSNEENKMLKKTLSYAPEYGNKEIESSQHLHVETVINNSRNSSPVPSSVPKVSIQTEKSTDIQNEHIKTSYEKNSEVMSSTLPPPKILTHTSKPGSEEVLVSGHLLLAKKLSDDAQDRPSKFFDSDKDDKTTSVMESQKQSSDHSQIKTNFKQAVSHQITDHNLSASEFRFPPNEFASTFCSGPPTIMRQNTMPQTYDGQCRSFPFHERDYSVLNKELHISSDIQARGTGGGSNSPHPAQLQSNLFLRQSSVTGQQLNSPAMEQISSHSNHSIMFPRQHSMLSFDGSLPLNQPTPIAQQPFLYTRQNSEVPYQADQQYYTLLHQTPGPYPVYQPSYVNSQPSVQMQAMWPTGQSMVSHGTPAQQPQYVGGYHQSLLSPPVTQTTSAEILPTDPRYPVFYHLCQLFNEEEVKAAMMAYPQETDPKTLVSFILQLKHIPS